MNLIKGIYLIITGFHLYSRTSLFYTYEFMTDWLKLLTMYIALYGVLHIAYHLLKKYELTRKE